MGIKVQTFNDIFELMIKMDLLRELQGFLLAP